jgi:hypothetical protein
MALQFFIYLPIFLFLLYLVVGVGIDVIAWLIDAIRQRRMARLLAGCKQLWWGQGSGADIAPPVAAPMADNRVDIPRAIADTAPAPVSVAERADPGHVAAQSLRVVSRPAQAWNGVERRGQPRTLRPFSSYAELDEALDETLRAEQAEARYKLENSDVWHAIGQVQQRAVDDVRHLIASIPRDTDHSIWQQSLYRQLLLLADRYINDPPENDELYWHIDEDQLSYYRPTVWEFVRTMTES